MNLLISEFLSFLIGIANVVIQVIFAPIDVLLATLFPDFSSYIGNIDSLLLNFTNYFNYVVSYIPPLTRSLLLVYIAFLISYYSFSLSYKAVIAIIKIIEKFKS